MALRRTSEEVEEDLGGGLRRTSEEEDRRSKLSCLSHSGPVR